MADEIEQDEMREADEKPKKLLPGRRLRSARESSHLTVNEVANYLRLDVQLIQSLEEDKYDDLPGAAYICGYLRSYARLLKLPENEIVQAYTHGEDIKSTLIPENVNILPQRMGNKRFIQFGIMLVLMLLITAGLLWIAERLKLFDILGLGAEKQAIPAAKQPASEPSQIELVPPAPSTFEPGSAPSQLDAPPNPIPPQTTTPNASLQLKYQTESWTEVKDKHGNNLVFDLIKAGSYLNIEGEPPLWVLLGYAQGVEVIFEGRRFDHKPYQRDNIAIFTLKRS